MIELSDEQFDALITRAMDELPQKYIRGLENVAITYEDEPSAEQKVKMKLDDHHLLLGLYEGVPLTQRGSGWSGMLPDKITLFKHSILAVIHNENELFEQIKRTLWHEIAHYYGLDHARIHELQTRNQSSTN
jgi:predicted Zn-dependent protease with MMP-like domain